MDWCNSTDCDLSDSTRTTNVGGSVCTDFTTKSDLTSDISSTYGFKGSLTEYQIQQQIGRGKYSQVYIGVNNKNEAIAIKRVQIFDMMDASARHACLKEVKHLQSLEHPNIVKCYNSFIQDNELIIILEWAQAGDLGRVLKERLQEQQYFSETEIWRYFIQVCSAVKHMHDRRMMHRDLKPSNIFISSDGTPKLGDLGLSRYFSSRTVQALTTVGTPYYMSPECIKGQPYDFSSDIWSLGVLLYEMITLKNPFYKESQSLYALGKTISTCSFEPLGPHTPKPFRDLVNQMLQATPQNRPNIDTILDLTIEYLSGDNGVISPEILPMGHDIYLQNHLKRYQMRYRMKLVSDSEPHVENQMNVMCDSSLQQQKGLSNGLKEDLESSFPATDVFISTASTPEQPEIRYIEGDPIDNEILQKPRLKKVLNEALMYDMNSSSALRDDQTYEEEQEAFLQQQLFEQQQMMMQQKLYQEQLEFQMRREQELEQMQQQQQQQLLLQQQQMQQEEQLQIKLQQQQQHLLMQQQIQQQQRNQRQVQHPSSSSPLSLEVTGVQKPIAGSMPLGRSLPRR